MRTMIILAAMLSGCIGGTGGATGGVTSPDKARYLCVGMEQSARFGSCPGCEKDAKRLADLMKSRYGYAGETLISQQATKAAVVEKLRAGINSTPEDGLFLFMYSGHGGQEYLGGKEPSGADRADEYLCLYDSHMLDDEIWDIVSKCNGRVFLYFDACHSATMYRGVKSDMCKGDEDLKAMPLAVNPNDMVMSSGFKFDPSKAKVPVAKAMSVRDDPSPRILCWSGCKESEYSYGGSSGGTLTTAVLMKWKPNVSYGALWENVRSWVVRMQSDQRPVQTFIGKGFSENTEAFK